MSPPPRPRVLERVADGATERAVVAEHLLKIGAVPRLDWRLQGPALRATHRLQRAAWPAHYTDADSYRLPWVDPGTITHHVNRDEVPRVFGRVAGGDWDRERVPFAATDVHRSLEKRFEEGADLADTALSAALLSGAGAGGVGRDRTRPPTGSDRRALRPDRKRGVSEPD